MNENAPDHPPAGPDPATLCARPARPRAMATSPLVAPLQLSVVYRIEGLDQVDALYRGEQSGPIYARDGHPNASELAGKVAALEGAEAALVCGSGMGAEAALLLALLGAGDHLAISDGVYGKTATLAAELGRFGVRHTTFDPTRPESLRRAMTGATKLVFAETISNPLLRVADVPALAEIAHAGGAALVIDHTFAPLLCRPIELGADAVTHSATKLIGGHSDLTLGVVAGGEDLIRRASATASTFGMNGSPFDCWLALRGVATLALRVGRTSATALELARRLEGCRGVEAVHYPGLESHPDHALASRLLRGGFGAMMAIDLGSRRAADGFIRGLETIPFAPSLGDVATTVSHPATTSHRGLTEARRAELGIGPGLVRISVGLEHPDDLWAEIERALGGLS